MALVVTTAGELRLLLWTLKAIVIGAAAGQISNSLEVMLFKNDYIPVPGTVLGSLTEADFTGYARTSFNRADWGAITTIANKASVTAPDQEFDCTGGSSQTVYGYAVLDPSDDVVVWAERFGTAQTIANGETITVRPKFTGCDEADV